MSHSQRHRIIVMTPRSVRSISVLKRLPLLLTLFSLLLLRTSALAQPPVILMYSGTETLCNAVLYDAGFNGDYGNNENNVLTFCPGVPGAFIQIAFNTFDLGAGDVLNVYDGTTNLSPLIGQGTGSSLAGLTAAASPNNPSGCLTLEFISDAAGTGPGFEIQVLCDQPCIEPTAVITALPEEPYKVCVGESITFDGSGSAAAPGRTLVDYIWTTGDGDTLNGPTFTYSYGTPGEYLVTLTVQDDIGCYSLTYVYVTIRVSTLPVFDIQVVPTSLCVGESAVVTGLVTGTEWTNVPQPFIDGLTALPDGGGVSYNAGVNVSGFPTNTTISSATDITQVCLVMEHSYFGDLQVYLTCPNGQQVTLFQGYQSGTPGNTYLGDPFDASTGIPGTGWLYCFSTVGTFGTMVQENGNSNWIPNTNAPIGNSLPPGQYTSQDPFSDWIGCDLNGTWTLTIVDNLFIDDGFIFSWWLDVDPSLYPTVVEYTPTFGAGCDSTYWSGPNIVATDANCEQITITPPAAGSYDYTYTAIDDFGCTYDTTITVTVTPAPTIDVTSALGPTCASPVQLTTTILPPLASGPLFHSWSPSVGLSNANVPNPTAQTNVPTWYVNTVYPFGHPLCAAVDSALVNPTTTLENDSIILNATCNGGNNGSIEVVTTGAGGPWSYSWTDAGGIIVQTTASSTTGDIYVGEAGTYTIVVSETINGNGCTDTVVAVIEEPTEVTILLSVDDTTICKTGIAELSASGAGGTGTIDLNWSQGLVGSGPHAVSPVNTTLYSVCASDANGCMSDTLDVTVTVLPNIAFTMPDTVLTCPEVDVVLNAAPVTGGDGQYLFDWQGNGPVPSSSYTVNLTASQLFCVTVNDGCETPVQTRCTYVSVTPIPDLVLTVDSALGCEPFAVEFTVLDTTTGAQVQWDFGDGVTTPGPPEVGHTYADPGSYDVSVLVTWPNACQDDTTLTSLVVVEPLADANFFWNPSPTSILTPTLTFTEDAGPYATQYVWDFAGLGTATGPEATFTFPDQVGFTYPVELWVTNYLGCADSVVKLVEVKDEFLIYVPDVFTPDGDGINEVFRVMGNDIDPREFELLIFDRWGEVVFSTTDPNKGWSGAFGGGDGEAVQEGVYPWRLRAASRYSQERRELFGHVTLLK
ncbi:MAG: PKD domain-containing protein [Flavobacteriales bacterium]|nr:PKD domain-containing protein [Flavobacteriales bacterium]